MLRDRVFRVVTGSFAYIECAACGTLYIDPLPKPEEITAFYPPAYWWEPAGNAEQIHLQWASAYRQWVVRDHLRFLPKPPAHRGSPTRLLDAGCGSGAFLCEARKQGYAVTGLDFSAQAVLMLKSKGIEAALGTLSENNLGAQVFDVITLFHVLEHLADPQQEIGALLEHLVPGGDLIVQVPDRSSMQARIFADRWYGLDPPRHLTQFTRAGVLRLLEAAGLKTGFNFCFSLRDNAPAMASSLFPGLDPKARMVRRLLKGRRPGLIPEGVLVGAYLSLVVLATPLALIEAAAGAGGTRIVQASKSSR
jgi:SAM-dependent methyltransferase